MVYPSRAIGGSSGRSKVFSCLHCNVDPCGIVTCTGMCLAVLCLTGASGLAWPHFVNSWSKNLTNVCCGVPVNNLVSSH